MKNSKSYLTELLDTFPQLTPRERQLCSYFFNRGVNYVTQEDRQVPVLFKPKQKSGFDTLPDDYETGDY